MFKKYLITAMVLTFTMASAYSNVPIFGAGDSVGSDEQIELTPSANYTTPKVETPANEYSAVEVKPIDEQTISAVQNDGEEYTKVQSDNFKSAIQSLDGAQVTIREQLINYKARYTDAKMRYDASSTECKQLKKQIKAFEKQLKDIEATKKDIAKNITVQ